MIASIPQIESIELHQQLLRVLPLPHACNHHPYRRFLVTFDSTVLSIHQFITHCFVSLGNCRLRKSLQRFPGENSYRDCITIKQHSVGFECRGVCQGASCVPTYVSQNFNMSCPDGIRSVPVNVVVHCDCR